MLVLGRKLGEEICLGGNVRITIVQLDGHSVRLGIDAPREVRVSRAELLKAPKASKRSALNHRSVCTAA